MRSLAEASIEQMDVMYKPQTDADKNLLVIFNMEPHHNKSRSAVEGRPIYEDKEYVMIMVPGDKDSIVHRPVQESDKMRFGDRYERFLKNQSQEAASGTPLSAMTWITRAQVKELEYFNCFTVEHLASMPDGNSKFMGFYGMKKMAQDFVKASAEQAPLTAIRAELEAKDAQLEAANRAIAELGERLKAVETASEGKKK